MDLTFKPFDGRKTNVVEVIDQTSNQVVGQIYSNWNSQGIEVTLFDRKYERTVGTYEECFGFIKGVECVLRRVTSVDDGRKRLEHRIDDLKERLNGQYS